MDGTPRSAMLAKPPHVWEQHTSLEFPHKAKSAGSILLSAPGPFVALKSGAYFVVVLVVLPLLLVRHLGIPNETTCRQHRGAVRLDLPVDGLGARLVFGAVLAVYYAVLHFGLVSKRECFGAVWFGGADDNNVPVPVERSRERSSKGKRHHPCRGHHQEPGYSSLLTLDHAFPPHSLKRS